MKWLAAALVLALTLLQCRLWLADSGAHELVRLESAVATQRAQNDELKQRNQQLAAEVADLKNGFGALEERARSDLGMVAANETFYQVVPAATDTPAAPAAAEGRTRTASR
jgi:cell division protein FtsB